MSFPEEQQAIKALLQSIAEPVIVDLGAHVGDDEMWMLSACKPSRLVLVEPDPVNFQRLRERFFPNAQNISGYLYDSKTAIVNSAIADHEGECEFFASAECGGGFGSIYQPLSGLSVLPEQFTKIGPIPCTKFDTLYDFVRLDHIDLLWVDIHGAEKDMIRFGQKALKTTKYLFIEFFERPVYEGMATGDQLRAMLPGWNLIRTFQWNMLLQNTNL